MPSTIEVVRPERTIVRDVDEGLPLIQGGSYQPTRDATPWIRFCVDAHLEQARRRLEQIAEAGARWSILEGLVARRGWPDRDSSSRSSRACFKALTALRMRRADVSAPTAGNDLRRLLDGGLVARRGKGRTTRYVASDELRRVVRDHLGARRG